MGNTLKIKTPSDSYLKLSVLFLCRKHKEHSCVTVWCLWEGQSYRDQSSKTKHAKGNEQEQYNNRKYIYKSST